MYGHWPTVVPRRPLSPLSERRVHRPDGHVLLGAAIGGGEDHGAVLLPGRDHAQQLVRLLGRASLGALRGLKTRGTSAYTDKARAGGKGGGTAIPIAEVPMRLERSRRPV